MKGFFEKVIMVIVKNNRKEKYMRQEEIKQDSVRKPTVELPELANWIKKRYPEEFILQIEFEIKENKDGKG